METERTDRKNNRLGPEEVSFASTDFPSTINGNDPREEDNEAGDGGALCRKDKGGNPLLSEKAAGAGRLHFSQCVCDAANHPHDPKHQ